VFYLGIHQLHWLERTTVPLFVSRCRFLARKNNFLARRRKWPRARGRWVLDSGAFSEIRDHGRWRVDARTYADQVSVIVEWVGGVDWVAIQDWMCEPPMLVKTGLSIAEHQARTVRSFVELRQIAPDVPWVPVLQGWRKDDYLDCVDQYLAAGVDLAEQPVVGLGSVCRRQGTDEFVAIVRALVACGVTLHGFGVKTTGLARVAPLLASSDSLAWSFTARRLQRPGLPECVEGGHKNCANCLPFALSWRERLLAGLPTTWRDDSGRPAESSVSIECGSSAYESPMDDVPIDDLREPVQ
jgi:hypothetical protein